MKAHLRHDPAQRGPLQTATVKQAAAVVDKSGMVPLLEMWEEEDRTHPGGRPPYLSMRATLILWLIVANEQEPMHIKRMRNILQKRLTPKACAILDISYVALPTPHAMYERARVATNRILTLMDAFPLDDRRRRLTKGEYQEQLSKRAANAEVLEKKARRAHIFRNQFLEATYQLIPKRYRPDTVSLIVDATRVPTYARGIGKYRLEKLDLDRKISVEPDFGFYLRTGSGKAAGENAVAEGNPQNKNLGDIRIREYALEHELGVLYTTDPDHRDATPNIILTLENHVPGVDPIGAARRMVDSLWERGHTLDHFTSDRGYMPKGDPEALMNPLRERGVKLVFDYNKVDLGKKEQKEGAILVEGAWYCPSMPEELIEATRVYRQAIKGHEHSKEPASRRLVEERKKEWKRDIAQREQYLFRSKEKADERGRIPLYCPAAGPSPTVTCAIKPNPRAAGRNLLPILDLPKAPGKACTNKTSTSFHINDGGTNPQHYRFGTPEWEEQYNHPRNQVESTNAYIKDTGNFGVASPARRRMRGRTAQSFLLALTIVAVNLKIIRNFLFERDERAEEAIDGVESPRRRVDRGRKSDPQERIAFRRAQRAAAESGRRGLKGPGAGLELRDRRRKTRT